MRIRIAGLVAVLATVLVTSFAGSTPAMADSTTPVGVHFYNDGWYWAYADIWAYDANGKEIYHDWSGSVGHTGNRWFTVPAGARRVHWIVRMEPFGNTIHEQDIQWWYDSKGACSGNQHATIYVGGTAWSTNHYDLHCSNW